MGRHKGSGLLYTEALADEIVRQLRTGKPLTVICAEDGMPCDDTVRNWQAANPAFDREIARSRKTGAAYLAWSALDIADNGTNDYVSRKSHRAGRPDEIVFDADNVQRSKLRVWTRFEIAKRVDPQHWGDKTETKHTGTGPNGEIETNAKIDLSELSVEQKRVLAGLKIGGEL